MPERILVVEDEATLRLNVQRYLSKQGHEITMAPTGEDAIELLTSQTFDVVLTDLRLPSLDGLAVLEHTRSASLDTVVLIMTAYGSLASAVEALRRGAHDYLLKPISLAALGTKIQRIAEYRALGRENQRLRNMLREDGDAATQLDLESSAMRTLQSVVARVAAGNSNILITGESGTGKEIVARALHELSHRRDQPFVPVNVSAISPNLVESTLFGHERGAFTGAERRRDGLFRAADGGTLFLDEIGELPLPVQATLLRAVETKMVLPVGSDRQIPVDLRIVSASHRDLSAMARTNAFREDLLYRLSVVRLDVAPLRERLEDIPTLVSRFVAKQAREQKKRVFGVEPDVMQLLVRYPWPGNVRELSNVIERAVLLSERDLIGSEDLPLEIRGSDLRATDCSLEHAMLTFERRHVASVLASVEGNREKAAKLLAISPATLYRRLEKLGLKGYRGSSPVEPAQG